MSSVEKVSNVLDDRKEAVVTTPLSENKSLTKDVDKKDLDNFEVQSKASTGWFKLDSGFKTKFSTIHPELYKKLLKKILKIKTRNCIERLLYRSIKNLPRQNM